MDVMQVCNLRLFLLFFLGWRKPLLWFMIFQGKKMVFWGDLGLCKGWSDAFGGRGKFEGWLCWETKTSFVFLSSLWNSLLLVVAASADTWWPGETNKHELHSLLFSWEILNLYQARSVFYIDGWLFELLRYLLPYR
jgi:hypothetical protein